MYLEFTWDGMQLPGFLVVLVLECMSKVLVMADEVKKDVAGKTVIGLAEDVVWDTSVVGMMGWFDREVAVVGWIGNIVERTAVVLKEGMVGKMTGLVDVVGGREGRTTEGCLMKGRPVLFI